MDAFDVISMDFRGNGKSGGGYTFSALECEDLSVVVDYARSHYGRVGVIGFSLGGAIAIITQAKEKKIDSLVAVSAPMALGEAELRWWRPESFRLFLRGCERGAGVRPGNPFLPKPRAIDSVGKVSPSPILFIHGTRDPTVDARHSRALFEAARDPKEIRIIEGASHAQDIYRTHRGVFLEVVLGWFQKTLSAGG